MNSLDLDDFKAIRFVLDRLARSTKLKSESQLKEDSIRLLMEEYKNKIVSLNASEHLYLALISMSAVSFGSDITAVTSTNVIDNYDTLHSEHEKVIQMLDSTSVINFENFSSEETRSLAYENGKLLVSVLNGLSNNTLELNEIEYGCLQLSYKLA